MTSPACDTVLFASVGSGLANRLRALVGYEALSRLRNCRFCVYWRPEVACEASYTDLFEHDGRFQLITMDEARALDSSKGTLTGMDPKWFHQSWKDHAPDIPWLVFLQEVRAAIDRLAPVSAVKDAVASFLRAHPLSEALGVHIRHTDNVDLFAQGSPPGGRFKPERQSSLDGFVAMMDAHIETVPVFLTTDNAAIERMCRARFGDRLVTYPKSYTLEWAHPADPGGPTPSPVRTTAVSDALVELLLLASCRRIVGTYYSSFSKFAAIWGEVDYLEMTGAVASRNQMIETTLAELRSLPTPSPRRG